MTEELLEGTVTVLFTDVQGSTELRTSRGDDAAHLILRAQEELVRAQIEAHSGREVKALGDGLMVAFSSARRAVQCAVGIQKAIDSYNKDHPAEAVQVRIGLNSGEVNQEDGDLFGAAVNAASRVASKAKGGEVLVAGVVKQLAGKVPEVNFVDRGRFRLKGFDERWQLFQVAWEKDVDIGASAVPTALTERTPLVGRDDERAELFAALDAAAKGQAGIFLIGGEPGVGKTRLASEILAEADRRGFRTFIGRCYESEGTPPYQPFIEVLQMAVAKLPRDVIRGELGDSAGELARILPELRQLFDDIPEPLDLPPEQERRYLFNSIRDVIVRAAEAQPVCVLFDDIQWADEASLLLMEHVAQSFAGTRVLILGTYRDVELDLGRPLARTLDSLHRQRLARRMSVRRLDRVSLQAMLKVLSGKEPPFELVEAIFAETEGNPFFVEEVYKHLLEAGQLLDADGNWRPDLSVSELDVPESVRLVIGRRLERLDPGTRKALAAAAVVGRGFTFSLLGAMGGDLDEDQLFEALDEAERAQLLSSSAQGREVTFTFAHELIRQTLIGNLSTLRRQRLHLQVADAMEKVYGEDIERHALEMAYHLTEAGASADQEKVALYFVVAGEQAMEASAFAQARRLFKNAIEVIGDGDPQLRARALAGLGGAYRAERLWDESRASWSEAIDLYESIGDRETAARICNDVALAYGWSFRWEDSLLAAGRGLGLLGESRSATRAMLLALSGVILGLAGNYDAGDAMTTEAVELAEAIGDRRATGYAYGVRAILDWAYLALEDSAALGQKAIDGQLAEGDLWGVVDSGVFVAFSLLMLGRTAEVITLLDRVDEIAERVGHVQAQNFSRRVRFFANWAEDAAGLRAYGDDDYEKVSDLEGAWLMDAYANQGLGSFWQGDWEAAERLYRQAIVEAEKQPWIWNAVYPGLLIVLLAHDGRWEEARAVLEEHRSELPEPGVPSPLGAWGLLMLVVEALVVMGEKEEAAALYPAVADALAHGAWNIYGRLVDMVAGLAAAAGRDYERAEQHFESSLDSLLQAPRFELDIDSRRFYAAMLTERATSVDIEKATALLGEALEIATRAGAVKHADLVRQQKAALPEPAK